MSASRSARIAEGLVAHGVVLALERGQRKQVLSPAAACSPLLAHEREKARALPLVEVELLCSVSTNPLITVSGVLSSCDTLAMKSRRMRATPRPA